MNMWFHGDGKSNIFGGPETNGLLLHRRGFDGHASFDGAFDVVALLAGQAGSFQIRPVHPYADEPAKRVLIRAVKTGKAPLQLLPPLVLHDRSGAKHAPEAEAILRGEADLGWG